MREGRGGCRRAVHLVTFNFFFLFFTLSLVFLFLVFFLRLSCLALFCFLVSVFRYWFSVIGLLGLLLLLLISFAISIRLNKSLTLF